MNVFLVLGPNLRCFPFQSLFKNKIVHLKFDTGMGSQKFFGGSQFGHGWSTVYQRCQDFFVCGPNFYNNFHLGPQSKISAKQNFFLGHCLCLLWENMGKNLDYAMLFLITKRSKGSKNKLQLKLKKLCRKRTKKVDK